MATNLSLLEEHLSCPICCDIFQNPVGLQCSHNFCQTCLEGCWESMDHVVCPVCRKECSNEEPRVSLALKGLCESLQSKNKPAGPQGICLIHEEKLKLFCSNDKQLICVVCHTSKAHKGHECCPIDEAVSELRDEIKAFLLKRKSMLGAKNTTKMEHEKLIEYIKCQAQRGKEEISAQFIKLRQNLEEEEAARMAALGEEEEHKCEVIRQRNEILTKEVDSLSETVEGISQEMETDDITFLKNYKSLLDRVKSTSTVTPDETHLGMLMDLAKHIGSLKFQVWTKMTAFLEHTPITMDPNTVATRLTLSDDLTSVTYSEETQPWPDIPERMVSGVLGSEGFTEGKHYWDVLVGESDNWTLGVVKESITRKKLFKMDPESGLWSIRFVSGKYRAGVKARTEIHVEEHPLIIRLLLDFDKGVLTFLSLTTKAELYTFKNRFTEKVYPYFNNGSLICPLKIQKIDLTFKGIQ